MQIVFKLSLLLLGLLMPQPSVLAQDINGLTADSSHTCFISDNQVHIALTRTGAITGEIDPQKDTHLLNVIARQSIRSFHLGKDSLRKLAFSAVKKMRLINATYQGAHLFVGVRFNTDLKPSSQSRYALLKFNDRLQLVNYFVFLFDDPKQYFTLPPYYELAFTDSNTLIIPMSMSAKSQFFAFKLLKNHTIQMEKAAIGSIGINALTQVLVSERSVIAPLLYPVRHSAQRCFFQFPYPVFYDTRRQSHIDPFEMKSFVDSVNNISRPAMTDYTLLNLDFEGAGRKHHKVLLAACERSDTLLAVVEDRLSGRTDCLVCTNGGQSCYTKPLEFDAPSCRFIFNDQSLLVLKTERGKVLIRQILISDCLKH